MRTTHAARAASWHASLPARSRQARSPASKGTTPDPTSVMITTSFRARASSRPGVT